MVRFITNIVFLGSIMAYHFCLWIFFIKADQSGWKAIIPIYNLYIALKIIDKPMYLLILFFIPILGGVFVLWLNASLAKQFEQSWWHGLLLTFLPLIYVFYLAYSDNVIYKGKKLY